MKTMINPGKGEWLDNGNYEQVVAGEQLGSGVFWATNIKPAVDHNYSDDKM